MMDEVDFTTPWPLGDVILTVEGKSLHANRGMLCMWSPVMQAMLNGDDQGKEKNNNTKVELKGKPFVVIQDLLYILHPPHQRQIHGDNVKQLLPLVHEYQIDTLVNSCEDILLCGDISLEKLYLAEEYGLSNLRKHIMRGIMEFGVQEISTNSHFLMLSHETQQEILVDKLQLIEDLFLGNKLKLPDTICHSINPSDFDDQFLDMPPEMHCSATKCPVIKPLSPFCESVQSLNQASEMGLKRQVLRCDACDLCKANLKVFQVRLISTALAKMKYH